jgi:hypothetical protein
MRAVSVAALALIGSFAATCGDRIGDDDTCQYVDVGECEPPAGAATLGLEVAVIENCLFHEQTGVKLVGSQAEWDAMIGDCAAQPPPVDYATEQIALVAVTCTPIDARFLAETSTELVIGVHEGLAGFCVERVLAVTVPRGKPVRAASCRVTGEGDCPPIP